MGTGLEGKWINQRCSALLYGVLSLILAGQGRKYTFLYLLDPPARRHEDLCHVMPAEHKCAVVFGWSVDNGHVLGKGS